MQNQQVSKTCDWPSQDLKLSVLLQAPSQAPPSAGQVPKQGTSLSAFSRPLLPRNPSSNPQSRLGTPSLPAALLGGLQPQVPITSGPPVLATAVAHPLGLGPQGVPALNAHMNVTSAVAGSDSQQPLTGPSPIAGMGSFLAAEDLQAVPVQHGTDAATAVEGASSSKEQETDAKTSQAAPESTVGPAPSEAVAQASAGSPVDQAATLAPASGAPAASDAHEKGGSEAEHPPSAAASPVLLLPDANGLHNDMAGSPRHDQPHENGAGNGQDPAPATVSGTKDSAESPAENGGDAFPAHGETSDKGPAEAQLEAAADCRSQPKVEALEAASQPNGTADGAASMHEQGLLADEGPKVALGDDSPVLPPAESVMEPAESVLPAVASATQAMGPQGVDPVADAGLTVIGKAAGIPQPAASEAAVAGALPEILMADGFLAIGPPSPPKALLAAARHSAESLAGVADPDKADAGAVDVAAPDQPSASADGISAMDGVVSAPLEGCLADAPTASAAAIGQAVPTTTGSSSPTAAAAAPASQPTAPSAPDTGSLAASAEPAAMGSSSPTAAAAVPASQPAAPSAPDAGSLTAAADAPAFPQSAAEPPAPSGTAPLPAAAAASVPAMQPDGHGPSPFPMPLLQPLQPPRLLGRPGSAGEGPMRTAGTAKGGAPSLMGLLRTIGPPRANSPAVGTPLASIWPQVSMSLPASDLPVH